MRNDDDAPALLTVDLAALAANYKIFQTVAPRSAVAGIVKADAYGLGMAEIVSVLESHQCPFYFVATLDEAIALRVLTKRPVAVLGGPRTGDAGEFLHHDIMPVLNCLDDIDAWRNLANARDKRLPAAVHFDTGMNRLGLDAEEAKRLLSEGARMDGLHIDLVMSHFACADDKDHPLTARQYESFSAIAGHYPRTKKSLANSSGIFRDPRYHYDMVRPGMALYGLNPTPETTNPMEPVVSLQVKLLQVRDVPAGESVGYSAGHVCARPTRIGTVALGYADGFLRSLSGRGALFFQGHACLVVGRVSMDLVTVDLGATGAAAGDWLEVIGPRQDADALAAAAGTIGYEILTDLGKRYRRTYRK